MSKDIKSHEIESVIAAPVSAIIPCFCCSGTIARAVASISQQTRKPAEVILIDDASPDEGRSLAVLYDLRNVYRESLDIEIITLPKNVGVANARNAGWEQASQPYIAFLDADDAWHPEKIRIQYKFMQEHPRIAVCGHRHKIVGPIGLEVYRIGDQPVVTTEFGKHSILLSNRFVTPSVMLRRDLPLRFAPGRRHMEDHLLWMQVLCEGFSVVRLEIELAWIFKTSFGVRGLSSDMWAMERGSLSNYWSLGRSGCINQVYAIGLMGYSFLKYIRRLVIVVGRAMFRSVN